MTLIGLLAVAGGVGIGLAMGRLFTKGALARATDDAARLVQDARRDIERLQKEASLEAKDRLYQARQAFEQENRDRRNELVEQERRLNQREQLLDKKMSTLDQKDTDLARKEKDLAGREKTVAGKEISLEGALLQQRAQLEAISGMSAEEAKKTLIASMEQEARFEAIRLTKRIEDEAREAAERTAREIIVSSIQRYSHDYVNEATVSVVQLPNDEMKGRIIGREGRNIRAFETVTGIDVIIDDTPEAVILSGFDPVRREIAKRALQKLVTDGRIHPARIEEIVAKVQKEVEDQIIELGEAAVLEVGVHSLHPEIVKLLGRLQYRTSYGQNILQHSKEVAWICGIMAAQLGFDVQIAKRAGLLHDLGKAVTHEVEGAHAQISMDFAKKYGEPEEVVRAVGYHHHDPTAENLYAVLVMAADAVSGARPGARRESIENYVKRLEALEKIADSFPGVEKSYAIQAGREVRIIVEPKNVDDARAVQLAADVARRVERELQYPGQIKVVVIRETRAMEYAK